ncbi:MULTISPECIES: CvpA family protein [Bacillus]|uniref:CvpA family protein n=1 Tax=Bacillus TaxID=1386 RepID=UPI0024A9079F|nr:CvpA family protein [Bacillus altitudinis]MDI6647667.1 CvpA family protein [Bacillus altitudinis]MDI6662290.1 CvpA family protein [Bacillus altitudinis]WOI40157.1 CvpA family protein [Bacillus altitudinis]
MIDIIILFLLLMGTLVGLKRGFILQFIKLISFVVSILVASLFYQSLAPQLTWIPAPNFSGGQAQLAFFSGNLETAYYNTIAFIILFILTKILLAIIGGLLTTIASIPVIKQVNKLLGAVLGFLETYLFVFILLFVAALLPVDALQTMMSKSMLADAIVSNTPYLSGLVKDLWSTYGV